MLDNIPDLDEILARRAAADRELREVLEERDRRLRDEQRQAEADYERAQRDARVAEAARRRRYEDLSHPLHEEAAQLGEVLGGEARRDQELDSLREEIERLKREREAEEGEQDIPPADQGPQAKFTPEVNERHVRFDASASTGRELRFHWSLGDGRTWETRSPVVSTEYAADGRYDVSLRVTEGDRTAEVTHLVVIGDVPSDDQVTPPPAGAHGIRQDGDHYNGRPHGWVQWLCAIVLGLIALGITWSHVSYAPSLPWWAEDVLNAAIVVGFTGLGFYLGGLIGWYIDRSRGAAVEE